MEKRLAWEGRSKEYEPRKVERLKWEEDKRRGERVELHGGPSPLARYARDYVGILIGEHVAEVQPVGNAWAIASLVRNSRTAFCPPSIFFYTHVPFFLFSLPPIFLLLTIVINLVVLALRPSSLTSSRYLTPLTVPRVRVRVSGWRISASRGWPFCISGSEDREERRWRLASSFLFLSFIEARWETTVLFFNWFLSFVERLVLFWE